MNKTPTKTIKGPCYIERGAAKFQVKGNVTLAFINDTSDVESALAGKIGKILEAQRAEAKFTPLEFSRLEDLFPFINWVFGDSVISKNKEPLKIYSRGEGNAANVIELPTSIMISFSALSLGSKTDPLGEFTILCLPDFSKSLKDPEALCKETVVANGWNPPSLVSANILRLPFFGMLKSSTEEIAFDFEDGASVEFNITLSDDSTARTGLFDKLVDAIEVSAKFKCKNISEANWRKIAKLYGFANLGDFIGGGSSPDLIIRGAKAGDYEFTIRSAEPDGERQLIFSRTENRFGELTFVSTASDVESKFSIGLAEADYVFGQGAQG